MTIQFTVDIPAPTYDAPSCPPVSTLTIDYAGRTAVVTWTYETSHVLRNYNGGGCRREDRYTRTTTHIDGRTSTERDDVMVDTLWPEYHQATRQAGYAAMYRRIIDHVGTIGATIIAIDHDHKAATS